MTTNQRLENALSVVNEHLGDVALIFVDKTERGREYVRLLPVGCREPIAKAMRDHAETKTDADAYDIATLEGYGDE